MSDDEIESYPEEEYDRCDNCGDYRTVISCPNRGERIEYSWVSDDICEECCREIFKSESNGCLENIDECPRVKEIQEELIEKTVKEHDFVKFEKHPEFFINSSNSVAIGGFGANPEKIYNQTLITADVFYEGKKYDFLKVKNQNYGFSKSLVDEALEMLAELGEEGLEYLIIPKPGIFVLKGYGACAMVGMSNDDYAYTSETSDYLSRVWDGYEIFKENVNKEIALINLSSPPNLAWNKLNPAQFEELCCGVISSFETISDCVLTSGSGDEGRDMKAVETIKTITGTELRNWLVQCKHYPNHVVGREQIDNLGNLETRFGFDVYCIMTSGKFGPNAVRLLESFEKEGYTVKYMDRQFLEEHIRKHPDLLSKFPALSNVE